MSNVFIVTHGLYSDYHICGVFSDKDKAKQFINMFSENDYNDEYNIEEMEVNPFKANYVGRKAFFVRMDKNGNTLECHPSSLTYGFHEDTNVGFDIHNNIFCHVIAKDEKHAIKITNEKRSQLIALNQYNLEK